MSQIEQARADKHFQFFLARVAGVPTVGVHPESGNMVAGYVYKGEMFVTGVLPTATKLITSPKPSQH